MTPTYALRVNYEDTDFSGFVYHANYLKFCERARSDYLRVKGVDQKALFAEGVAFVVRRMDCNFLAPARFEDELTVATDFREMAGARFELFQTISRGADTLFTAAVTVVLIDGRGRPKRISPELAAALTHP
ncbi:MAG: YbgC/FadM family acyl-CoA thioesterase [Alphaproteobacteria bacterium]|nr:YbgC/FadM family acyl-CoA thioesterase [Alphaproteobacteria bacterium]